MPVVLTQDHFPLVIATASGSFSDRDYKSHLEECLTIFHYNSPYVFAFDATQAELMAPSTRKLQAEWTKEHRDRLALLNLGAGIALTGFQRPLLTAIHWLSPPPYRYAIFGARKHAIGWCLEQLRAAHVALPQGNENYATW